MRSAVRKTAEFSRVRDLPRRELTQQDAEAWAEELTPLLACRGADVHLRPWQAYSLAEAAENDGAWLALPVGVGKALAHGEPVLTPTGWVPIEDLKVGDQAIGSDGAAVTILGVYPQGMRETWRVTFSDGSYSVCDAEHLWTFRNGNGTVRTRTTADWAKEPLTRKCGEHRASKLFLPMLSRPVEFSTPGALPIDPYTLGALLGDGGISQRTVAFTTMDRDILDRMVLGEGVTPKACTRQNSGKATQYNLTSPRGRPNPLLKSLDDLGLQGSKSATKFIPQDYLHASVTDRIALLQGLLDTDGYHHGPGSVEFTSMSPHLAEGVRFLVETLGGTVQQKMGQAGNFRQYVKLPKSIIPFACDRRRASYLSTLHKSQRPPYRAVVSIKREGIALCTCIKVDATDSLFVTRSGVLTHNTLIAELLPVVMKKRRPILVMPASLRDKTYSDRVALTGKWRLASPPPRIVSLEELAPETGAELLNYVQPDLIIIDEADELANFESSAAQRIDRYVRDTECACVPMTGTPGRKSIMNYWHLLCWALKDGAPVPVEENEASEWARALDEKHGRAWSGNLKPGPLGETTDQARAWFGKRLRETHGVVVVDGDSCDQDLIIRVRLAKESKTIDKHFRRIMTKGENPRGIPCADPLAMLRAENQTGCGLCQYWDPPPPDDWMTARREFAAFCRTVIKRSRRTSRPIDTEKQVRRRYADHPIVQAWEYQRPLFEGVTAVEWLCDSAIETAEEWLEEEARPGVVWCGSVEFAERLAERTGLSYYARQGRDRNGRGLFDADPKRSLIASWHANKRGFNLQAWRRAAVFYPPSSAKFLEQTFGRHHRAGQTEPVTIDMFATSGATLDAFDSALAEAGFVKGTIGLTQKILRADISREIANKNKSNRYRWAQRKG